MKRMTKKEREIMFYKTLQSIYAELKAMRIHMMPCSLGNRYKVSENDNLVVIPRE